jgi:uncharacterized membrane protein (DUF2068 family)
VLAKTLTGCFHSGWSISTTSVFTWADFVAIVAGSIFVRVECNDVATGLIVFLGAEY